MFLLFGGEHMMTGDQPRASNFGRLWSNTSDSTLIRICDAWPGALSNRPGVHALDATARISQRHASHSSRSALAWTASCRARVRWRRTFSMGAQDTLCPIFASTHRPKTTASPRLSLHLKLRAVKYPQSRRGSSLSAAYRLAMYDTVQIMFDHSTSLKSQSCEVSNSYGDRF